jgi:hypothetical protein
LGIVADFNGVVIVQNYLQRAGRDAWMKHFLEAAKDSDSGALDRVMASYGKHLLKIFCPAKL